MTLEAFAQAHNLPRPWLELRRRCEEVVRQPDFGTARICDSKLATSPFRLPIFSTKRSERLHREDATVRKPLCTQHLGR